MLFALIAMTIFAVAAFAGAVIVVLRAHALIEQVHKQTAELAVSQHDSGVKYATAMIDRAEIIAKHVDDRVASRIKGINAILKPAGAQTIAQTIEEAPPPPVSMGGMMDDLHEVMRDANRFRRENDDAYDVRDTGVGIAEEI